MAGPPKAPSDANAEREAKLAQALRANLRRRKVGGRPQSSKDANTAPDREAGD
jgi:hypothetical protein